MDADLRQLQDENRPLGTERDRLKKELEEHAGVTRKYAVRISAFFAPPSLSQLEALIVPFLLGCRATLRRCSAS